MRKIILLFTVFVLSLSGCSKNPPANTSSVGDEAPVADAITPQDKVTDSTANDLPLANTDDPLVLNSTKEVYCWGDSLTQGFGGEGVTMPDTLEELSGANVHNYGIFAEKTNSIAARCGANPLYIENEITIPADLSSVEIVLTSEFGSVDDMLIYGDEGLNYSTIDGIRGQCSRDESGKTYFTRSEAGTEKRVAAGTIIIPSYLGKKKPNDITIIWAGGNDKPQTVDEIQPIIDKIDLMIERIGCKEYLVLSEMNEHERVPVTDEVNLAFEEHYKEHFLNLRAYMMGDALKDKGLEFSDDDLSDLSAGEIPGSLKSDSTHGNSLYYQIAGEQVYKKCQELGYLY